MNPFQFNGAKTVQVERNTELVWTFSTGASKGYTVCEPCRAQKTKNEVRHGEPPSV